MLFESCYKELLLQFECLLSTDAAIFVKACYGGKMKNGMLFKHMKQQGELTF